MSSQVAMDKKTVTEKSPYGFWAKAAVISLIIIMFTQALVSPALASIQASFPDVDTTLIQQIVALPTLLMIISSLICGQLCIRIGYRRVAYITIILTLIGGVMPAILNSSIYLILFWRAVFGLGYGLSFSLCIASIGALWSGSDQTKMLGLMTGVGALCAMAYSTVGGYLAGIDWRNVFYAYLIIIPFAAVIIAKLPEPQKKEVANTSEGTKSGKLGIKVIIFSVIAGLGVAFTSSFMTNVAMVIVGGGMGQPAQVGFTMTLFSLGMAAGAFLYHTFKTYLKRFLVSILFIIFGVALCLMNFTHSLTTFTILAMIYGACFGMINPEWEHVSVNLVDSPSRSADGASLFVALQGVGQFIGPFLLAGLAGAFGFGGIYYQWIIAWPCLLATGVILFLMAILNKKKA